MKQLAWCALLCLMQSVSWAGCLTGSLLPTGWRHDPHAGQAAIPAGQVVLGTDNGYADERPGSPQQVASFWIDRTEVTNAQFSAFVRATGYVTDAERRGGAAVFHIPSERELNSRAVAWWRVVKGADWRHPEGPGSTIAHRERYPVVLVTQADALAYARWLGRDLPTEAEWEYAAKAGKQGPQLDAAPRDAQGHPAANYWQGSFPVLDLAEDGHAGLAPVGCYAPNAFGLYDVIGNAWEWTRDVYSGPHQSHANGDPSVLRSPPVATQPRVVIKGGSYLCSPDYCVRYRAAARESQEPDMPTSHVGFRTVSRP
ncbi:formylglycine-generating enzyme family protein [Aquabacterium sp.]|uniref:formylglycine-generating enzyme family protein n=1 Tax=Aquabacterium sp. TaxID=1872578 RepID=UPI0035B40607